MSRTYRRKRPRMRLGNLDIKQYPNGTVRDGTPQHADGSCDNHGGCPWCYGNHMHKHRRNAVPITLFTGLENEYE